MIVQIFVSSTWLDLQPERKAVEAAIQRLRETKYVGMEYFGSRDEDTRSASLDEVDRSEVYIGIFGGRYGSGITEDEYRRARQLNLPCFNYFKEGSAIAPEWRDQEPAQLDKLKDEIRKAHTVITFDNPDDLAAKLTADLHRWLIDHLNAQIAQAAQGKMKGAEVESLFNAIRDNSGLDAELLARARNVVNAIGEGNVGIGGDVKDGVIALGGINIKGDGNVLGSKNKVIVTKTTTIEQGMTLDEFTALVKQLRELLQTANLTEDDRGTVETNLKTIEKETGKDKPRLPLIEASIKSIESLVKSTEGIGTVAAKLLPLIPKAVEFARGVLS